MKQFLSRFKYLVAGILLAVTLPVGAQLIYGNTFPFWNVNGPLTVTGTTTLSGTTVISGATTLSGGTTLTGTATSAVAATGIVGEYAYSQIAAASAIAGASTTNSKDITSVSLTAGDWDVSGTCYVVMSGMTSTIQNCGLGTTADTLAGQAGNASGVGVGGLNIKTQTFGTTLTGTTSHAVGPTRVALDSTTSIRLVYGATYSAGSFTQYGNITARRVR